MQMNTREGGEETRVGGKKMKDRNETEKNTKAGGNKPEERKGSGMKVIREKKQEPGGEGEPSAAHDSEERKAEGT